MIGSRSRKQSLEIFRSSYVKEAFGATVTLEKCSTEGEASLKQLGQGLQARLNEVYPVLCPANLEALPSS